jgi:hypothetical protein
MAVLVVLHVLERWGPLIQQAPQPPRWPATLAGAVGLLPFGAAMTYWGLSGPGSNGPQGMDLPAQRTVLAVTGILGIAAFVVPALSDSARRWPRLAWLTTWTGCCITALQGPAQILLAQRGEVEPAVALIAVLSTPGACVYGLSILNQRLSRMPSGGADGATAGPSGSPTRSGPREARPRGSSRRP